MSKKWLLVFGFVCALFVCALAYSIVAKRANHNAVVIRDSAMLVGLVDDWNKSGEPQGTGLERLLSNYGTFKPFVYTNSVDVGGKHFVCLFAVRDAGFAENGKLAVTRDRTVIWIGQKGSHIVPFNR